MTLSKKQCEALFPFHLEIGFDGLIIRVGSKLQKLLSIETGVSILGLFRIVAPRFVSDWLPNKIEHRLLVLEHIEKGLKLKGELLVQAPSSNSPGVCYFLCHPVVRSSRELKALGLRFMDFPKVFDVAEYFLMINAHEQTAAEARRYADELEKKNLSLGHRDRLLNSLLANLPEGGAVLLRGGETVLVANGSDLPSENSQIFSEKGVPLENVFGSRSTEIREIIQQARQSHGGGRYDHGDCIYRYAISDLPHEDSEDSYSILIFQNITEDLKLLNQAERLQRLDSVGHLAGGIAHDFNNYLASILGNISAASESPDLISEALKDAESACVAARRLTRQLLTFSKGGAPVMRVEPVEQMIYDSVKFSLSGSDIVWRVNPEPDLWAANYDEGQISQIINNLCVNASQALRGVGAIDVNITNQSIDNDTFLDPGPYVKIDIRDDGPGIAPEVLERIWDPYFTTKSEGSGLGLATCHSIAERHGGRMAVKSTVGEGTLFSLWLPAVFQVDTHRSAPTDTVAKEVSENRILLMDDQAPIRIVADRLLRNMKQRIVAVEDGIQAIGHYQDAMAEDDPFDLVILDLTIPGGLGGVATLERIMQINPEVYAVVCSGYVDDDGLSRYRDDGFTTLLSKPFTAEDIKAMLQEHATAVA